MCQAVGDWKSGTAVGIAPRRRVGILQVSAGSDPALCSDVATAIVTYWRRT
jgi:hypothetical protein